MLFSVPVTQNRGLIRPKNENFTGRPWSGDFCFKYNKFDVRKAHFDPEERQRIAIFVNHLNFLNLSTTMTSPRERVLTALKRNGTPDRTPFEISWGAFTPLLMKTYREKTGSELPPEEYFDFDTRSVFPGPHPAQNRFYTFLSRRGRTRSVVRRMGHRIGADPVRNSRFQIPSARNCHNSR